MFVEEFVKLYLAGAGVRERQFQEYEIRQINWITSALELYRFFALKALSVAHKSIFYTICSAFCKYAIIVYY